jgi:hypothetical protein
MRIIKYMVCNYCPYFMQPFRVDIFQVVILSYLFIEKNIMLIKLDVVFLKLNFMFIK